MTRDPRNPKDHLVSLKLITHAYCLQGPIGCAGGFFGYFSVLYSMGFLPMTVFKMAYTSYAPFPSTPTPFDPTRADLGNPALTNENANVLTSSESYVWMGVGDNTFDLRYFYVNYDSVNKIFVPAFPEWNTSDYG